MPVVPLMVDGMRHEPRNLEWRDFALLLEIVRSLPLPVDADVLARHGDHAAEAMGEKGGLLRVYARMDGEDLLIGVSDTGPGIPEEIQGRMFQSFVTAGKQGGTGLGLAIVKKIVHEHKGTVGVRSSPQGATFELRLPQGVQIQSVLPERGAVADEPSH